MRRTDVSERWCKARYPLFSKDLLATLVFAELHRCKLNTSWASRIDNHASVTLVPLFSPGRAFLAVSDLGQPCSVSEADTPGIDHAVAIYPHPHPLAGGTQIEFEAMPPNPLRGKVLWDG